MEKILKIAVVLTAYDKMSQAIAATTNAATKKLQQLQQRGQAAMARGMTQIAAGAAGFEYWINSLMNAEAAEDATLKMKNAMARNGGIVDEKIFKQLNNFATATSNTFTGSATDYKKMITVMQQNGLQTNDIINGTGEAVAKLAVLFDAAPDSIAQFAARMRQDMGVAANEMSGVADLVQASKECGVGKDGAEAVMEMSEAFSKAGLGAANLGIKGLEASEKPRCPNGYFYSPRYFWPDSG